MLGGDSARRVRWLRSGLWAVLKKHSEQHGLVWRAGWRRRKASRQPTWLLRPSLELSLPSTVLPCLLQKATMSYDAVALHPTEPHLAALYAPPLISSPADADLVNTPPRASSQLLVRPATRVPTRCGHPR